MCDVPGKWSVLRARMLAMMQPSMIRSNSWLSTRSKALPRKAAHALSGGGRGCDSAALLAQQWQLRADATLSPGADGALCVTAHEDAATGAPNRVSMEPCDGRVEQHWAFHGVAPGDPGGGSLSYGTESLNLLGVVAVVPRASVINAASE